MSTDEGAMTPCPSIIMDELLQCSSALQSLCVDITSWPYAGSENNSDDRFSEIPHPADVLVLNLVDHRWAFLAPRSL